MNTRTAALALIERLTGDMWFLRHGSHESLLRRAMLEAKEPRQIEIEAAKSADEPVMPWDREDAYPKPKVVGRVAIVPLQGAMAAKLDNFTKWWVGMADTAEVQRWVEQYARDPAVDAIVLDVDSPGGNVVGLPELADAVAAARAVKPVIAYTDSLMASAAYYASVEADAIYASQSAVVGSIGTLMAIYDYSKFFEDMGLSVELFKSGTYKGAGYPGTSLTDAQRENFQQGVDTRANEFRMRVAARRPVAASTMQGQTFFASEAIGLRLVDALTRPETARADALRLAVMRRG